MKMIDSNLILLEAELTREELIKTMAEKMLLDGRIHDMETYMKAVYAREGEISTNLGGGVAIPHGKTDAVKIPSFGFVRLKEPISWGEEDPVKLVFQIAVPESESDLHLELISKLARRLIYDEFKEKLMNAKTADDVLMILENL